MEGHDAHHLDPSAATAAATTTGQPNYATMAYWKGNAPGTVVSPIHERAAASSLTPQTEAVESRRPSDDGSSLSALNGQQQNGAATFQPIRKSATDPTGDRNFLQDGLPAQRTGSTPTVDPTRPALPKGSSKNRTERPAYTQRTSTMMKGLRRAATGTMPSNTGHQYSYTFDPMSSDSDSSSSSEDDGPAKKRKTPTKKNKEEDTSGWDGSEKQRKADAKAGKSYSRFKLSNSNVKTKGRISKNDGRLKISINETENNGYVAKALGKSIKNHLDIPSKHGHGHDQRQGLDHEELVKAQRIESKAESVASALRPSIHCPRLNIVIMVIGSRGDIQPFIKIGKLLKEKNGHRVRIATHPAFKDFISDSGLEFFSVGGNPSELMAFMVKNPGLIPNMSTVMEGEIGRRRDQMAEMFEGFWRACVNSTDDESDPNNVNLMNQQNPFIADAIIANPPSFAHVHIAERLGIPLHMMFTFPYSPTQAFPHPLANIKPQKSNVNESYINFMSYPLVEMMTFQGLGDLVNNFREKTLGLEPVSQIWAPGALYRMKVPYTYMWSPSLVPKPKDWGPEIDIGGFVFLDLASDFKPPQDLQDFLDAGEQPVYIGFGSIVVDDADAFTQMIFKAVELAGVRALVNKGWGGLGGEGNDTPDNIFMLGNTPHDWLFPRVKAVVHHGGAGTTAMGLKCGKPTMIVPFFGDQPFWGAMVAEAKAGAHECIPYKKLNAERLAEGIKQCMLEESQVNIQKIADSIAAEGDGAENAVRSFHRSLPVAGPKNMRCSILEDRAAVWVVRGSSLRLSTLAAQILVEKEKLKWQDLKILRHYEWNDFDGPGEPITGTGSALMSSMFDIGEGVGMVPVRIAKHVKKREEHARRKEAVAKKKEMRKQKKAAQAASKTNPLDEPIAETPAEPPRARYEDNGGGRPKVRRDGTNNTVASTISADPEEPLAQEVAEDIGRGFKASGAALLTMPMDVHMAIAQGFHNAPRLWGDATVRKPVRITGFKSGWTAARREFGYGVYDGWTGLVTQPAHGWKDEVTMPAKFGGLGVGLAKGVGGLVIKNVSAIVSPPAYLVTGVRKYVSKRLGGPSANLFIRRAHMVQGFKDVRELAGESGGDTHNPQLEETTREVLEGWAVYEDLWTEVTNLRHAHGNGPRAKMRVAKEKKRWDEMGALESVRTAREALRAYREHEDVDALFKEKRKETLVAQMPRAPAMARTATYGDKGVLTNGRKVGELDEETIEAVKEDVDNVDAGGRQRQEAMDVVAPAAGDPTSAGVGGAGRKDSEATAVPSDSNDGGEERKERNGNAGGGNEAARPVADDPSEDYFGNHDTTDKPKLAGRELSKMQVGPERVDMAAPNGVASA
jgi:UDP:flavonoid glycosyltransferase YjiC (YdhE family)